jgi:hypothetical protein
MNENKMMRQLKAYEHAYECIKRDMRQASAQEEGSGAYNACYADGLYKAMTYIEKALEKQT